MMSYDSYWAASEVPVAWASRTSSLEIYPLSQQTANKQAGEKSGKNHETSNNIIPYSAVLGTVLSHRFAKTKVVPLHSGTDSSD